MRSITQLVASWRTGAPVLSISVVATWIRCSPALPRQIDTEKHAEQQMISRHSRTTAWSASVPWRRRWTQSITTTATQPGTCCTIESSTGSGSPPSVSSHLR